MNYEVELKIALADDHAILRKSLVEIINNIENCKVVIDVSSGKALIENMQQGIIPDIIFLDLNMPEMNGFEAAKWLQQNYPAVNVLVLTMYDTEQSIIRLMELGVKGFIKKDSYPTEIRNAIESILENGFYYSYNTMGRLAKIIRCEDRDSLYLKYVLNETELNFLSLVCSDLTYKEIAQKMGITIRGVDTLRDNLFEKLDVKSRVGMAMYACRNGIYL